MKVNFIETGCMEQTIIQIEGLSRPMTLFHVTDAHLNEADERDPGKLWHKPPVIGEKTEVKPSTQQFQSMMNLSRSINADYTVLTGDITSNPSMANIDTFRESLKMLGAPYLYTLGNHDWHFPALDWNDQTRSNYYSRFYEFTDGNPAYQTCELDGLKLIAVDNSNYQVTEEQLAEVRVQLADGKPAFLFLHIPIYIPSLVDDVVRFWGSPIMMAAQGWEPEKQKQWKVRDADPSTIAFYEMLINGEYDHLLAIFCGHVHFNHLDAFRPNRYQYVTRACYDHGYRIIRLMPL